MCPPQAQAPLQQQQQPTLLTEGALLSGEKPQAGGRLHRLFQRVRATFYVPTQKHAPLPACIHARSWPCSPVAGQGKATTRVSAAALEAPKSTLWYADSVALIRSRMHATCILP